MSNKETKETQRMSKETYSKRTMSELAIMHDADMLSGERE